MENEKKLKPALYLFFPHAVNSAGHRKQINRVEVGWGIYVPGNLKLRVPTVDLMQVIHEAITQSVLGFSNVQKATL